MLLTPEEKILAPILKDIIEAIRRANIPPHAAVSINGHRGAHLDLVCSGATPIMGYRCSGKPGHTGQCFSEHKLVWFDPEEGGPDAR
jgi:hypothetical protein